MADFHHSQAQLVTGWSASHMSSYKPLSFMHHNMQTNATICAVSVHKLLQSEDTRFAKVNRRRMTTKTFVTTNLIRHLNSLTQLSMNILKKLTKTKWLQLKLFRAQSQPQASGLGKSLGISEGSKKL